MNKYIIVIFLVFFSSFGYAQNCDWTDINSANLKYDEGNFDDALEIAQNCLTTQSDVKKRIEALRLMSKTYIALDEDSAAYAVAAQIIAINPKFEPYYLSDPPRFIEIINYIKKLSQQFSTETISKKVENINEAPATAIALKSKDFKNRGYLDFEAVLHDLPGFDISRSNGNLYSHVYQRGYRSINTNRTLFLIDGVEDNDLWSGNVYLSRQFITTNVKSFDVVYGPASTMYGSNAFLGVMNIVSKNPSDMIQTNHTFGTNIHIGYGSYNTRYFDGTLAFQTKDHNVGFMLSGRTFFSNEQDLSSYPEHDYAPIELTDELALQYHQQLDITDSTATSFINTHSASDLYLTDTANNVILTDLGVQTALKYDNNVLNNTTFSDGTETYAVNAKLKVYDFTLGFYYWQKAEGPGSQYNDSKYLGFNQGQSWRPVHYFMYVKYDKDINDKLNFSNFLRFKTHAVTRDNSIVTYGKHTYLSGTYDLDNLLQGTIPTADSIFLFYKSNQLRNETKFFYHPSSKIDVVAGLETRFSSNQGDYFIGFENNAQQLGFTATDIPGGNQFFTLDIGSYAQSSINIMSDLSVLLGGRYDFNRVRTTEGYGSVFNERVAVVYSPNSFIFKGIFATAFKDATNREKYSTAPGKRELPNPLLQPERVKNFEFSVAKLFNSNISNLTHIVSLNFYYSLYSNIIQEVQVLREDGTYTNQNQAIGQAQIYGVNAYSKFSFAKFTVYANYTFTQPYAINPTNSDGTPQVDSLGNTISKLRISDIANNRANIGVNYAFKKVVNVNVRANYVGQRITGESTTVPTNTSVFNPYFLLNSTISYSPKKTGLTIQLTGFNLLNSEYFEPGLNAATGSLSPMLAQNRINGYLSIYYQF